MPPQRYKVKDGGIIVESDPLGVGQEGAVYRFRREGQVALNDQVVKIYLRPADAARHRPKLDFLVSNPPTDASYMHPGTKAKEHRIAWPTELVFAANGTFVGFTMPRLDKGITLEEVCNSRTLESRAGAPWKRFVSSEDGAQRLRAHLAQNLAESVATVHDKGFYTLCDLKPANALVKPNGLVTLLDVDGIQIAEGGRLRFPAQATTPEYAPPEAHMASAYGKTVPAEQSWDAFALAVIVYKLLLEIHPFSGHCRNPLGGSDLTQVEEKIRNRMFPFGRNAKAFDGLPPPQQAFRQLDKPIQDLFIRCFDEGIVNPPVRPTAREWYDTLGKTLGTQSAFAQAPVRTFAPVPAQPPRPRARLWPVGGPTYYPHAPMVPAAFGLHRSVVPGAVTPTVLLQVLQYIMSRQLYRWLTAIVVVGFVAGVNPFTWEYFFSPRQYRWDVERLESKRELDRQIGRRPPPPPLPLAMWAPLWPQAGTVNVYAMNNGSTFTDSVIQVQDSVMLVRRTVRSAAGIASPPRDRTFRRKASGVVLKTDGGDHLLYPAGWPPRSPWAYPSNGAVYRFTPLKDTVLRVSDHLRLNAAILRLDVEQGAVRAAYRYVVADEMGVVSVRSEPNADGLDYRLMQWRRPPPP